MVFDWFRRRTPKDPDPTPPQDPPPPASSTPNPSPPAPASAPVVDYLAYAKAAYAAIQAQQSAAPPADTPVDIHLDATVETAVDTAVNTVLDPSPPSEVPPPQATLTESAPEALTPPQPSSPVTTETGIPTEPGRPPGSQPPVAFFDLAPKAATRLEALEATAVVEEAPPPPSPGETAPTATQPATDLAFDAGFRWSAEILAAQGRQADEVTLEEITWLQKLQQGLGKTRRTLANQLKALVGRGPIDAEAVEEIETVLLQADVGVAAADRIIQALQKQMRQSALPPEQAIGFLKDLMRQMLNLGDPTFAPQRDRLNIWLIVGVNGAGKTTTIGKIANLAQESGYKVLIAAADTFRAAAVEQLTIWGQRSGVDVIANSGQNTDPAAVVFDAISAAQSRGTELLLVDTAGRLQNKKNLMEELHKIRRIISKKAADTPIESLLVLDATLGQNGLRQAEVFAEAAELTGVVLTKLDSTAKGGVAFGVVQQLQLPIRFIGAGEGIQDLRPFSSYEFVEALLADY